MKLSKLFNSIVSAIKAESILSVSEVKANTDGFNYVELKYPTDFGCITGNKNGAINESIFIVDDPDGIELILTDHPDSNDSGSARTLDELHDYVFVSKDDRSKYKSNSISLKVN